MQHQTRALSRLGLQYGFGDEILGVNLNEGYFFVFFRYFPKISVVLGFFL